MPTRRVRIVCISDTHNQTPKLPAGDVLIHAGDLTNQGSYAELNRTVEWLEKSDFQAKIVVAGNHDTTLDPPFFHSHENKWKWPSPQDPEACKRLLIDSPSITYLQHEAATIYLPKTRTHLGVFGSPYSPGRRGWAFQYWGGEEAEEIWETGEMEGADVVITHSPALGCLDRTAEGSAGCGALKGRLASVRPMMHVCGHIHDGRGVERVRWRTAEADRTEDESMSADKTDNGSTNPDKTDTPAELDLSRLVESVENWTDPGAGNKKISLVDATRKAGCGIEYMHAGEVPRHVVPDKFRGLFGESDETQLGAPEPHPMSSLEDGALFSSSEAGVETWRRKAGGAIECRTRSDVGRSKVDAHTSTPGSTGVERRETLMINAAFLSARVVGKASTFNKPIVVDVELPVWAFASEAALEAQ
ncbi:hypothetical protein HBH98_191200 [Parastagonospora nodorum]|nr:hypothetical protein HBI09_179180 [Parastagonospora nodorum]KAH4292822.1 hypothetical protein HBI01_177890 [Parastagonospora nodorum]KAH4293651.1 hypothetical protein HBI02_182410 [Parastagonospora nodorum]KAH4324198.1 hypothetical protein HBI00_170880 [Parastagonospora nodorum]KAH4340425.1 hypothetical protein HBH98_191200 [Parastagonospora nodorum]